MNALNISSVDENLTYDSISLTAVARDFTIVFSIQLYFAYETLFSKCLGDKRLYWF